MYINQYNVHYEDLIHDDCIQHKDHIGYDPVWKITDEKLKVSVVL